MGDESGVGAVRRISPETCSVQRESLRYRIFQTHRIALLDSLARSLVITCSPFVVFAPHWQPVGLIALINNQSHKLSIEGAVLLKHLLGGLYDIGHLAYFREGCKWLKGIIPCMNPGTGRVQ